MEDYTKYGFKPAEELVQLLADKDNIFVIACNKCFKEFEIDEEPECGQLVGLIEAQGKHVTGAMRIDFLCNKTQSHRKLREAVPWEKLETLSPTAIMGHTSMVT